MSMTALLPCPVGPDGVSVVRFETDEAYKAAREKLVEYYELIGMNFLDDGMKDGNKYMVRNNSFRFPDIKRVLPHLFPEFTE